jgi:excinuclease ABC subunit C
VDDAGYTAAAERAVNVLRGDDATLLEAAAERRDALGEALRFEEAAELRDRIRDLEQVIAVQQRLSGFSERNVVLVTRDREPHRARLLFLRAGRLADEVSLPLRATPSHLRYLLRRVYTAVTPPVISRDELDDVLILDAWLRRHAERVQQVTVDPTAPDVSAAALREAVQACGLISARPVSASGVLRK